MDEALIAVGMRNIRPRNRQDHTLEVMKVDVNLLHIYENVM